MKKNFQVIRVGTDISYEEGLAIQEEAFKKVSQHETNGILILLEHSPVITIGRNCQWENLLVPLDQLKEKGIEAYKTNRGGNITFHGKGQLVGYPIFDLSSLKKDTHYYLRSLEEIIIRVLKSYEIHAGRKEKYTGVWIGDEKIAAIGIHVKKWITMHGFSLNLNVDKSNFRLINPCGILDHGIASLDDFCNKVDMVEVENRIIKEFEEAFNIEFTMLS